MNTANNQNQTSETSPAKPKLKFPPRAAPPGDATSTPTTGVPEKGKEDGPREGSLASVSNAEFVAALFASYPPGARVAVCTKKGDPDEGPWIAEDASEVTTRCIASRNNYLNCSSFIQPVDGKFSVRKDQFAALHFLIFDDVGTKVNRAKFEDVTPTWEIETSPGNSQVGILLREPITDLATADRLLSAIISGNLNDAGASGVSRWCRQPVAINGNASTVAPVANPSNAEC